MVIRSLGKRRTVRTAGALVAAAASVGFLFHVASAPAEGPKITAADAKVFKQLQQTLGKMMKAVGKTSGFFPGAARRKEVAPKVIPLLQKMVSLCNQLKENPKLYKSMRQSKYDYIAMMEAFGDRKAGHRLATAAADRAHPGAALHAQLAQVEEHWWLAHGRAGAQKGQLKAMAAIAKRNAYSPAVAEVIATMSQEAATYQIQQRTIHLLSLLKSPVADQIRHELGDNLPAALAAQVGKPERNISGPLLNGKQFSVAQWKGKPVMVDFWATWCGPCRMELPHVEKIYSKYHKQGLQLLGVSSDRSRSTLVSFMKSHPKMPWPQIFVPGTTFNPTAVRLGIPGIPVVYFIDRKGIVQHIVFGANPLEVEHWARELMAKPHHHGARQNQ